MEEEAKAEGGAEGPEEEMRPTQHFGQQRITETMSKLANQAP